MSKIKAIQLPRAGVNSETREITDTWEQIQQAILLKEHLSRYQLGDFKTFKTSNDISITMQIVGFDKDIKSDKTGIAAISWISKDIVFQKPIDSSLTNKNWSESELRQWLNEELYPSFPESLRRAIAPADKTYLAFKDMYSPTETKICSDRIWIPSENEVFGEGVRAENSEINYSDFFSAISPIKYRNGFAAPWHLRTNRGSTLFSYVSHTGKVLKHYETHEKGVVIGFCTDAVNSSIDVAPFLMGLRTAQILRGLAGRPYLGPTPTIAADDTWYKSSIPKNLITEINFINYYSPTGQVNDSWAADEDNTGAIMCYIEGTKLTIAGNNSEKIKANESSSYMFGRRGNDENYFLSLQSITGLEYFDTSRILKADYMFSECENLNSLAFEKAQIRNAVDINHMFHKCKKLIALDLRKMYTSEVTNMNGMFFGCSSLKNLNVDNFNTSSVLDMAEMFYDCSSLQTLDLSHFNTEKVKSMERMFRGCSALYWLNIGNFNTVEVEKINGMFKGCKNLAHLDVSSFKTDKVTTMEGMFYECERIKMLNLKNFNASEATTVRQMFKDCKNLVKLEFGNFITSKVTDMNAMFGGCNNLISLDLHTFDTNQTSDMEYMFQNCLKLENILVGQGWSTANASTIGMFSGSLTKEVTKI